MVIINGTWITSRIDTKAIQYYTTTIPLEKYLARRLNISPSAVNDIDRVALETARSHHRWARKIRTTKMLVDWLPVGHNWQHHGATSDKCPCCVEPDETFIHLFRCKHPLLVTLRKDQVHHMKEVARKMSIKMELATFAIHVISHLDDTEYVQPRLPQVLQQVWEKQLQIGRYRFGMGWISKQWRVAAKAYGSKDPGGDVAKLVTLIWDGWCEPIWELRNYILHRQPNPTELSAQRQIKERLKWFKRH